ncbi:unnamed protein product [Urochloa decumbens]|uniref:Uncharacterized protein n=1 Tax=Urochloa decumbens TaxID=240449 RepID=A0ABC8VXW5_9POAL
MAMAMVLRGARSGSSSQLLVPAIFRRMAQEGAAQGSSPAGPAAGIGRLMHTWHNSVTASTRLPFGRQVLSQQQKIMRMEQFSSRRSFMSDSEPELLPFSALAVLCAMALGVVVPNSNILRRIKEKFNNKEE